MTEGNARGTNWSLTLNNPTQEEKRYIENINGTHPGWVIQGQKERGENDGTIHYQLWLKTNKITFNAIKRQFPRAHITKVSTKAHLESIAGYVHKEDTREELLVVGIPVPSKYEFGYEVAQRWDWDFFDELKEQNQRME